MADEGMTVRFLKRLTIMTVAVLMAANVITGIRYDSFLDLLLASVLLGALNAFLRPILMAVSFSLVLFSLGLFMLVINAGLLMLTAHLLKGFHVAGFWPAFWGGLVISVTAAVLNMITGWNRTEPKPKTAGRATWTPPKAVRTKPYSGKDDGPVIDV